MVSQGGQPKWVGFVMSCSDRNARAEKHANNGLATGLCSVQKYVLWIVITTWDADME